MAYTKELEQKEEVFRVGFYTYSQWAKFYLKCKWLVALMPSVEPGDAAHPPVSRMLPGPCGESQILMQDSQGAPAAYGGSQARGPIGAVATGLRQSHSNASLWEPGEYSR